MFSTFDEARADPSGIDKEGLNTPQTSFPKALYLNKRQLEDALQPLLVNSDPDECNNSLCVVLKLIIENVYVYDKEVKGRRTEYVKVSRYALRLLTLNLFIKNYRLCIAKILGFLSVLADVQVRSTQEELEEHVKFESNSLAELLSIILFLLLKMKNWHCLEGKGQQMLEGVEANELYDTLLDLGFIKVIFNFISAYIKGRQECSGSYLLMKFNCDIIFEYFYHFEIILDPDLAALASGSDLIPTLIDDLIEHDNFGGYEFDTESWEEDERLFIYEEFKLLLLINEQYLMKSYLKKGFQNMVFEWLMREHDLISYRIGKFINLMIYYMNREESQISKILILKFFYVIFTTSATTKLVYLNDLKILLDIFLRELNDLDYLVELSTENGILVITYLKVLYPMLMFSQLSELAKYYKRTELLDLLGNLILNSESNFRKGDSTNSNMPERQADTIARLASRCLSVPALSSSQERVDEYSSNRVAAASNISDQDNDHLTDLIDNMNISSDSLGDTIRRTSSIRTSTRSDYNNFTLPYKRTFDNSKSERDQNIFLENNNNVFLESPFNSSADSISSKSSQGSKKDSDVPPKVHRTSLNMLNTSPNLRRYKKTPPPPPPPPPRRRHYNS